MTKRGDLDSWRYGTETDVEGKRANAKERARAKAIWQSLTPERQRELEIRSNIPPGFGEAALEESHFDIYSLVEAEYLAKAKIETKVYLDFQQRFERTGNPVWALQCLALWPPNEALPKSIRSYLDRSLRPFVEACSDMVLSEIGEQAASNSMRPTAAIEAFSEWFGLKGKRGTTNAFAEMLRVAREEEARELIAHSTEPTRKQAIGAAADRISKTPSRPPVSDAQLKHRLRPRKRQRPPPG